MNIKGDVIRNCRLAKGLTQTDISKGICTQANISNIEHNGTCPSITTISSICNRLEIPIDKVIIDLNSTFNHSEDIDNYIFNNELIKADEYMDQVNYDLIETKNSRIKYCYCQGYLNFHLHKNSNKAMFFYNQINLLCKNMLNNIYSVGASIGMLEIYLYENNFSIRHLIMQINILGKELSNISFKESNGQFLIILYLKVIKIYQFLNLHEEALKFYESIICNLKNNFLAFKLCELKNLKALSLFKIGKTNDALKHLNFAIHMGEFYSNIESINESQRLYVLFKKDAVKE
ncbi:helix-turn-helix domain-containing protein [Apilactobacillus sp. TMW 2.2459]|uniref:Helix-turn-helix domain-containing protein n=1 Tax=Apilactobacillus xinyiensis TaxID=2841032 RepID=A0ABT0HZJ1_9LACO|nr:helix-turn-helix transcriptional regulator [Apilactobacillus xinyiensis]MCK8623995.1 helix-turn-helix domain-containing protein [Apilactobacillus xinyiensis]MCL0311588.1 helix-turn-helix domain-containing protein [Apilactobacillus xinyiensis]